MRVGYGYDVHRLVDGRPLVLGGVTIPFDKGLKGHSDADVLLHAVCDALLGAAGLGDIGMHFPDKDPKYKNIASTRLLEETGRKIAQEGYKIVNLDATLVAEAPKIGPYRQEMVSVIAKCLGLENRQVNVKATTTEGLGITGRGEGMAATCVACLE
ncbi:2C-methyl-D-erythritol 2,4-cyclodiphosphate synthase [Desulfatibacillum aliphaticivorans]|uniref:2-C-methyl-D-erythritol 2,4-cyclodiphosphate synthase n=1 Tax=Desulfatibacillum aliphaticivorans TaxID=218208 RepID=ISPF_DESAL|nr:2-C-methyl-D-erythritol 2,4-cyclodiphosphate synthase [Desulfatibacillum aliphaticivorans]B8FHQ6.1 RecName: Full=2-C-methyl-D-erythritol 2,4-cyclodiphosphate synthase; Short=MECDP-synthase; Short=MECPP-synthase; Short=MECPS [Desulfatibacillum aliphaticivorans]ACL02473.1 2C-methyl-D-erythritol 2,4-cyclodiphosphate synthase [Desulfatibacillum aliphaticivorans]